MNGSNKLETYFIPQNFGDVLLPKPQKNIPKSNRVENYFILFMYLHFFVDYKSRMIFGVPYNHYH